MSQPTRFHSSRHSIRPTTALLATLAALASALFATSASATTSLGYVALGDSFTSGPGIPTQIAPECGRSDHNYPHLVATDIGATLTDASCGAAQTKDMTTSQYPGTPPQFDALRADTAVVTVSVGGNDAGFGEVVTTCGSMGASNPYGQPCTDYYNAGGTDQIAERLADLEPKLTAVVEGIRQRSPQARILVVGVPDLLPLTGSCWSPNNSVAPGDYPYLIKVNRAVNSTYAAAAANAGAEYVDVFTASIGHDICKPAGTRWVEGLFPNDPAAPVHPNALGMQGVAQQVTNAITG